MSKFDKDQEQTRKYAVEAFKDHEVTVLCNTPEVQMFRCQKPGTWMYGFQVVCADNMICLTGDIDSILIEPGYNRNGTKFLRGSVNSESYFLSKVRNTEAHTEYSEEYAKEYLLERIKEAKEQEEEDLAEKYQNVFDAIDGQGSFSDYLFHEAWNDNELDDHPNMRVMSSQAIFQLEAMKMLARKLDEIDFKNAVHESDEVSAS